MIVVPPLSTRGTLSDSRTMPKKYLTFTSGIEESVSGVPTAWMTARKLEIPISPHSLRIYFNLASY